jgi:hypothetical protein
MPAKFGVPLRRGYLRDLAIPIDEAPHSSFGWFDIVQIVEKLVTLPGAIYNLYLRGHRRWSTQRAWCCQWSAPLAHYES